MLRVHCNFFFKCDFIFLVQHQTFEIFIVDTDDHGNNIWKKVIRFNRIQKKEIGIDNYSDSLAIAVLVTN